MISSLLLGFSLALDCFAIAISQGIRNRRLRPLLILALLFGLFQGGMLLIGHLAASLISGLLARGMDFIAAGLLGWIGLKMLRESREADDDDEAVELVHWRDYLILSIATSIDALAAGMSLNSLGIEIWFATAVVGLFSTGLGLLGGRFGRQLGIRFGKHAEAFGGLVLIGLGVKALLG
ncbi:MAG: manganese efflux pump MntP [Candidatus Melainabacteria bacterium HGW-Melainabacteria-1]|nr:MAG: manganese efflux pump MntP [Candidatus Melainabacteria bacterium HGW-Melainabacteria-1]